MKPPSDYSTLVPPSANVDAQVEADLLHDWRLDLGDRVVIELIVSEDVNGRTRPATVAGHIAGATGRVLVLTSAADEAIRVPWPAIALVRRPAAAHPATT